MISKRRKFVQSFLAFAVLAFTALVSFHSHAEPADAASKECATCVVVGQFRSADPVVPAIDLSSPVFDQFHVAPVAEISFVARFSGPRPARAPPVS